MTGPADTLLGGIDVFHLINDRALRRAGLSGNDCLVVVELAGRLDAARLQRRLERAVLALPELRWRLDDPLLGRPRWVLDPRRRAPAARIHELSTSAPAELSARVEALLADRVGGERLWAVDVLRRPAGPAQAGAGDVLVFRYFHPLVDARGAERLVRWLGSGEGDEPEAPPPPEERHASSERAIAALDRDARIALARAYKAHVFAVGERPIRSLAGASPRGAAATPPRVRRLLLSEGETRAFDRRVRERARLAETSLMLLGSARLNDRLLRARGAAPPRHVIPVPISLDPKAGARRLLGNHLSMLHFALDREELADERAAVARLAEQQRAAVREKLDLAMIAALDLARWLPGPAYRWLREQPFAGELASLIFSNPGPSALSSFAGVPAVDAYHVPAVAVPPGLQIIFSRFAGRLSATIVCSSGLLREDESAALPEVLRADLLTGAEPV